MSEYPTPQPGELFTCEECGRALSYEDFPRKGKYRNGRTQERRPICRGCWPRIAQKAINHRLTQRRRQERERHEDIHGKHRPHNHTEWQSSWRDELELALLARAEREGLTFQMEDGSPDDEAWELFVRRAIGSGTVKAGEHGG